MKTAADGGLEKLYHYQGANLDYLRDTLVNDRVHFLGWWRSRPWARTGHFGYGRTRVSSLPSATTRCASGSLFFARLDSR